MTLKNKVYRITSMIALVFAFLAFCIVLEPEKVVSGIDNLFWNIAKIAVFAFWMILMLSDERKIFKGNFLTVSVAIAFVGIAIRQMVIPQVTLFLYVLAVVLLIYENDIIVFIKKYNEYKKSPNGIFADLILISLITFIIVSAILNLAVTLSVIIIMILAVMTWDLV
ncbi:MAG: hypothetical protein KAI71_01895 [Candidatus Pacebacteria bacterium]|nr:hypothetical protein [Candidatus Paceibacterota bacterium]